LITKLQVTLDPRQSALDQFRQMMAAMADLGEGPHLLVVDNASEAAAACAADLSRLRHWRILLTSREPIQNMGTFHLDALPHDEAVALYERTYEQPARSPALDALLADIGYHTLMTEMLAAYAHEKRLAPPALLALLREKGLMQMDDYDIAIPRYHQQRDIMAHLRDLFSLIDLNSEEQDILRWCCILPTSNLALAPELASEDFLCDLLDKKATEKDFKKRLRRLAKLHWLEEKAGAYRCHPVVAEAAKDQLRPDALNCAGVIEKVIDLLVPDKESNEHQISRAPFAPMGAAVLRGVWKMEEDFGEEDEKVGRLAALLNELFLDLGQLDKALDYSQKAVAIREKILPPEHPDLAASYNNLAETYRVWGWHQRSLEFHQKTLGILEKTLPPEHSDLATSYNNLAGTYGALGEHQKSLEYHQKALSIFEKALPSEHPDLASLYNNLALTYGALGEHQKRLMYNQKALAIREKVLPPEHPDLATSYNNLAVTYNALSEHKKSLEYNQKALTIREKVLPPEHPDLAASYNNLAATYGALSEHQKELEYNQKALSISEKVLPPEHPDLANSYNNLAMTYYHLDDLERAVAFVRRAVAIYEKALPATHPHTANARQGLAFLEGKLAEQPHPRPLP